MSINKVTTYAPSLVKVQLFGIPIEGFSKDDIVSIDREEPTITFEKAMDGSRVGYMDTNGTYKVTITLLATSPSNTWLHQLFKLYNKIGTNLIMPLTIEDKSNGSDSDVFYCTDTFFDTEPSTKYGSTFEPTVWTFTCHNASYDRVGSLRTYRLAEQIKSLLGALEFANSLGFDYSELLDTSEQIINNAKLRIEDFMEQPK